MATRRERVFGPAPQPPGVPPRGPQGELPWRHKPKSALRRWYDRTPGWVIFVALAALLVLVGGIKC